MPCDMTENTCNRVVRYWRRLLPAAADIQDRRKMSLSQRREGLKGMAYAACSVLMTGQTASRLSRLGQSAAECPDDGSERSARSTANNKIMYQYLRGERCPVEGPRGKYGFDLTAAVRALPGGEIALLWLHSMLWELLDSAISRDRLQIIQLTMQSAPQDTFLREYIELWIRYRSLKFAGGDGVDLQEVAQAIDLCHHRLRKHDAVFNYIYLPLSRYLELAEPQLPLEWSHPSLPPNASKMYERLYMSLVKSMATNQRRRDKENLRFNSGVDRYRLSGRVWRPDHRFLATFRIAWRHHMEAEKLFDSRDWDWRKRLESGCKALYKAWDISLPDTCSGTRKVRGRTSARAHSEPAQA